MKENQDLIQTIIEGIQEKKGKQIVTADLGNRVVFGSIFYHLSGRIAGTSSSYRRLGKRNDIAKNRCKTV